MGRLSKTEAVARGLLRHYLPDVRQHHNIRPTTRKGAKAYQIAQAKRFGFDLDNLEGDIYLEDFRTIVEISGIQHGRPVKFFHRKPDDFENQLERDRRKVELCRAQGIELYRLTAHQLVQREFEPFIRDLMKRHNRYEHYRRTTPPRVLYVQAEKLSRQKAPQAAETTVEPLWLPIWRRIWPW